VTQDHNPYDSVIDPAMRFDRCTSDNHRPGPLQYLRMVGDGRAPGCANVQPWWANVWALVAAAAVVTVWATYEGLDLLDTATAAAMVLTVWTLAIMTVNPRSRHGVCELCGQCSVSDGVPPAMTRSAATRKLRQHGWTVDPRTGRAHCRGHAAVPFIHTYGAAS
jgi:hypothetical protein